jgi:hypothetical protein
MRMKLLITLVLTGSLALTWETRAQFLSGSLTATSANFPGASATSSSLTMIQTNIIDFTSFSGNLGSLVPSNSLLTAHSATVSGLSSLPTAISINNFFVFSSPEAGFGFSTTPPNRFDFDLLTITETSFTGNANNTALFTGTGTIVDTTGAFQNTSGQFTIDFLHPNDYMITLQAVPEPATISLIGAGLLGIWALRRGKSQPV